MSTVTDSERIDELYNDMYKGNGKPGVKTRIEITEENICRMTSAIADITTNVSALLKYQVEDVTRTKLLADIQKDKKVNTRWQVAQLLALIIAAATILLS